MERLTQFYHVSCFNYYTLFLHIIQANKVLWVRIREIELRANDETSFFGLENVVTLLSIDHTHTTVNNNAGGGASKSRAWNSEERFWYLWNCLGRTTKTFCQQTSCELINQQKIWEKLRAVIISPSGMFFAFYVFCFLFREY